MQHAAKIGFLFVFAAAPLAAQSLAPQVMTPQAMAPQSMTPQDITPGSLTPKPMAPTPPVPPSVPGGAGHPLPGAAFVPLDRGATQAYNDAMMKMMSGMATPYSGDADRDFARHMIPHHQGAIDMAEIELKYGNDAKLKQLAGRIIATQQHEIATMESWLAKHPDGVGEGTTPKNAQWK